MDAITMILSVFSLNLSRRMVTMIDHHHRQGEGWTLCSSFTFIFQDIIQSNHQCIGANFGHGRDIMMASPPKRYTFYLCLDHRVSCSQ
jgi:hypothetical protein